MSKIHWEAHLVRILKDSLPNGVPSLQMVMPAHRAPKRIACIFLIRYLLKALGANSEGPRGYYVYSLLDMPWKLKDMDLELPRVYVSIFFVTKKINQ